MDLTNNPRRDQGFSATGSAVSRPNRDRLRTLLTGLQARSVGSALRRVRGWALGRTVGAWYHPSYRIPLSGVLHAVGMSPRRADDALTWLLDRGVLGRRDVRESRRVAWVDVQRVHDPAWIERLDQPAALTRVLGLQLDRALPADALLEMWRRATGGTVEAARWAVRTRGRALNLMGGFHHAFPDRGLGFCPINDVAIAVARLRHEGFREPILVLDLDAHPPDGIAACLADDPAVQIASLGVASSWEGGGGVIDRRLEPGTGDAGYLEALDALLSDLRRPALTFYLAGGDPLDGDRFGGMTCSEGALRQRDRRVLAWLGHRPVVILPAGGYSEASWRILAGTGAEAIGSRAQVAVDFDPVRRRTLAISGTLDAGRLSDDFEVTLDDVIAELGGSPSTEDRFLDYYTRHGLEYALERYGLLPAVRRMGFRDIQLDVTAGDWPHRLRVTAALDEERCVLVDLSLSRRDIGGWPALFIEWLELRDPRITFAGTDRPRLPGQDTPGLGLAAEAGHLLLRAAERLGLSAVALVPAWYHVAWMARDDFRALDPVDQGRLEALFEELADVPLIEATTTLHEPGWPTSEGPLRWEPVTMVRPVSDRLVAALDAQRPEIEAAKAAWLARLRR